MNIDDFKRVFTLAGYECTISYYDIYCCDRRVTISKSDLNIKVARIFKWTNDSKTQLDFIESITSDYEHIRNVEERKMKYEHTTEPIGKVQHICEFEPDKNGGLTLKVNPGIAFGKATSMDTVEVSLTHLAAEASAKTTLSTVEYIRRDVENAMRAYELLLAERLPTPTSSDKSLQIKNVIFADPATIVFWEDGTKTVVKAQNEAYDPEKGLAMAISKKALGNKHDYFIVFKKWLKKWVKDCTKIYRTDPDMVAFIEALRGKVEEE